MQKNLSQQSILRKSTKVKRNFSNAKTPKRPLERCYRTWNRVTTIKMLSSSSANQIAANILLYGMKIVTIIKMTVIMKILITIALIMITKTVTMILPPF